VVAVAASEVTFGEEVLSTALVLTGLVRSRIAKWSMPSVVAANT
jgi:hypothetical protein